MHVIFDIFVLIPSELLFHFFSFLFLFLTSPHHSSSVFFHPISYDPITIIIIFLLLWENLLFFYSCVVYCILDCGSTPIARTANCPRRRMKLNWKKRLSDGNRNDRWASERGGKRKKRELNNFVYILGVLVGSITKWCYLITFPVPMIVQVHCTLNSINVIAWELIS